MTAQIRVEGARLVIDDEAGLVSGKHYSQLVYWGFKPGVGAKLFVANPVDYHATLDKVISYFKKHAIPHTVTEQIAAAQAKIRELRGTLQAAVESR